MNCGGSVARSFDFPKADTTVKRALEPYETKEKAP